MILDEPTAGMDPEARATTRAIVADLRDAGAAILLTSHDLTDVERLADRICVLDGGRIVASGTPAELRAGVGAAAAVPARPVARRPTRSAGAGAGARRRSARAPPSQPDGDGGRYRLEGVAPDAALVAALAALVRRRRTG